MGSNGSCRLRHLATVAQEDPRLRPRRGHRRVLETRHKGDEDQCELDAVLLISRACVVVTLHPKA